MNVSAQLNFVQCKQQRHFRSGRSQFVGNKTKGRISKLVLQENKARQIFRKTIISYPLTRTRACAYQELRKFFFPRKFSVLCFLIASVLRFVLLLYYRQDVKTVIWKIFVKFTRNYPHRNLALMQWQGNCLKNETKQQTIYCWFY